MATLRLEVPAGVAANQLKLHLEPHSLRVEYRGNPTSAHGRLHGRVKVSECAWQIERANAPEYDPLAGATEQPPAEPDAMLISLHKEEMGPWPSAFTDAVTARPAVSSKKKVDEKAAALKKEWNAHIDKRRHQMLFGQDVTPLPPKPVELKRIELAESVERQRKRERRREEVGRESAGGVKLLAKEHWQSALAHLLMRDGVTSVAGESEHSEDSPALFAWTEDRKSVRVTAQTARGLPETALTLRTGANFVDCAVHGRPTPWCGVLTGKVVPEGCTLRVVPAGDDDAVCDTLELQLVKAEPGRLWRAPWPEMLAPLDLRERRSAAMAEKPRREWLTVRGFDEAQTPEGWEIVVPYRTGKSLTHDDWRVAVTNDAFSVYVAGQDDMPMIGGELHGSLAPAKCSWTIREADPIGSMGIEEIVVSLVKARPGMWPGLIKKVYV